MKYTTTILLIGMLLWPCASNAQDQEFPSLEDGETVWFEGVLVHAEFHYSHSKITWLYVDQGTLHDFYTERPSSYCGEYGVPNGFPKPGERFRMIKETSNSCAVRRIERLPGPATPVTLEAPEPLPVDRTSQE